MTDRVHFSLDQLVKIGDAINLQDFDHVFTLNPDGTVTDGPAGVYAPESVEFDESAPGDIRTDSPAWETVTQRMSQQYGYTGAIMHPSEYVGAGMARLLLSDEPQVLAFVEVSDPDDVDGDPAGWTIVRYSGQAA